MFKWLKVQRYSTRRGKRRLCIEQVELRLLLDAGQDVPCDLVCGGDESTTGTIGAEIGQVLPDFTAVDVNSASPNSGQPVSPRDYLGKTSVWYFSHATCTYCRGLFGYLNTMQDELAAKYPDLSIDFLGVNLVGEEAGNDLITDGRDLPWLQDIDANADGISDAWSLWHAAWRDVVIVNGKNEKVSSINLTTNNLGDAAKYSMLRDMIVGAAFADQRPWCNWRNPLDPNNDSNVGVADVQCLIDTLNSNGPRALSKPTGGAQVPHFYDVDHDGFVAPLDCLQIINYLNANGLVNSPPVAVGESYSVAEDQTLTVGGTGVLSNDADPELDSLTAAVVAYPAHGSLTLSANEGFTYGPVANFSGSDSFQYVANDGHTTSSPATVTISVTSVNDAPQALSDTYSLGNSVALAVPASTGVLNNDLDLDGDTLSGVLVGLPSHGTVSFSGDGAFTYNPAASFVGTDSFVYAVNDGHGGSATTTVTLQVLASNNFNVAANSPAGTLVGQVATTTSLATQRVYELVDGSLPTDLQLAPDDHMSGDPSASVVLIEYLDIQCPPCGTYHPIVRQLEQQFAGDLLVVRRHLPLTVIHPNAFAAAVAAEAAGRQGAFDDFIDLAYQNRTSWSGLTSSGAQAAFESYATSLGLSLTQFRADVADPTTAARVQRDMDAASAMNVNATPTFILNGQQLSGPPATVSGFGALIQSAVNQSTAVIDLDRATGRLTVANSAALNPAAHPSFDFSVRIRDSSGVSQTIPVHIRVVTAAGEGESTASTFDREADDVFASTNDWLLSDVLP